MAALISENAPLESDTRLHLGTIGLESAAAGDWDVLVIGAGPAGALAARQLSRSGARTLLVEKSAFPRPKVCGGCLNFEAVESLRREGLGHLVETPVALPTRRLALCCRGTKAVVNLPGGSAVDRQSFDAQLVLEAIRCGTEFLPATVASIGDRPNWNTHRSVQLQQNDHRPVCARGRVVLAADGLNCSSHRNLAPLRGKVATSCRIGVGAVLSARESLPVDFETIHMAIGRNGYVGLVRIPDGRVTIAAAIDPAALKSLSAVAIVHRILAECGSNMDLRSLENGAEWRGTSPLTRSHQCVAFDNVLVVGDAAGYVEPFTGDGMAAAIHSAVAVEPLVMRYLSRCAARGSAAGICESETGRLSSEWNTTHRALIGAAQRRCRLLSRLLRRPRLARVALRMVLHWPGLARPFLPSVAAGELASRRRTKYHWRWNPSRTAS